MSKPIIVPFHKGIQFPPKLGTLILKEAGEGKLAYAQNVNSSNDKYGNGVITPGPALIPIGNSNLLTGIPFIRAVFGESGFGQGYIYFGQGLFGAKNVIRRIRNVVSGLTPGFNPDIDPTGAVITLAHTGLSPEIVDMEIRVRADGVAYLYVSGKDATATWVSKIDISSGSLSSSSIAENPDFDSGQTNQFLVKGSENNLYWIGQRRVSLIDTSDIYTPIALLEGLPLGTYASAGADWNENLVVAYSTDIFGDFERRKSAGGSGVIIWDYESDAFSKRVPAPCRYISALIVDPAGNLLCFGGIDEGKSSIYEFTALGFNLLYTYIGDLPRSRHSVEFDGQGRICFHTVDGQFCRYDRSSGSFDHLASTETDLSRGGFLSKGIGSPSGNEFFIGSGSQNGFTLKRVSFDNFVGDGGVEGITTPLGVSGIIQVPFQSTITKITWGITTPLKEGEKVILLVYKNGSFIPSIYSTLDFAIDGDASSKAETETITDVNNFSLGIQWQMPDGQSTAPAVLPAYVEIS